MKKLLLPIVAAAMLFATAAQANHDFFITAENPYQQVGSAACSTQASANSLAMSLSTAEIVDFGTVKDLAQLEEGCEFHQAMTTFMPSEVFCKVETVALGVDYFFTVIKATVGGDTNEKFSVVYGNAEVAACTE